MNDHYKSSIKTPKVPQNETELWDILDGYSRALAEARSKWPQKRGRNCVYPEQLVLNCLMTCRDQNFVSREEYAGLLQISIATLYRWNEKHQVFSLKGTKKRTKKALKNKPLGKKVKLEEISVKPAVIVPSADVLNLDSDIDAASKKVQELQKKIKLKKLQQEARRLQEELEDLDNVDVLRPAVNGANPPLRKF